MLNINHRCCQMFTSLLNNHVKELNIVSHKIINTNMLIVLMLNNLDSVIDEVSKV